jgi:LPS O-antigen subunit length determinant protein (WzzB/FepE family)
MTEKKQQSTVQPEQNQGFASPAEDELDFIDLLKILARKKVFILAVTSVCTLFSIFYAQSIIPTYRAAVGLLEPNGVFLAREERSSFSALKQVDPKVANQVSKAITKPYTIFERFLSNLESHELKQEVFVNGGFQKKFFRETGIGTDKSVSSTYKSTKIVKRGARSTNMHMGAIHYLELEGGFKPKVMLEFLVALVETSKENVNTEINDIQRSIVKTRINNLSKQKQVAQVEEQIAMEEAVIEIEELRKKSQLEIEKLRKKSQLEIEELRNERQLEIEGLVQKITLQQQIEKEMKATKIARFSDALEMAKRMGIKHNNFDKPGVGEAPVWFQYGELALPKEITNLRSKKEGPPNTKSLPLLKLEAKLKLKKFQSETELKLKGLQSEAKLQSKGLQSEAKLQAKNLEQKRYQKIRRLRSKKEEISESKNLIIKKLTADLPLLKFKVVDITQSYSLINPNKPWVSVVFGVAFGLVIGIFMAFLIDLKKLRDKEIPSASK